MQQHWPSVTFRGSGTDLATDVFALLRDDDDEAYKFMRRLADLTRAADAQMRHFCGHAAPAARH